MKLRTPHDETHLICTPRCFACTIAALELTCPPHIGTNYGMAFTKDKEPSDNKFAMIDRSIAHLVRSIGKNAHTDSEFKEHMSKPEQQRSLSRFRLFVCLVGATKLCIKGVPSFQPNLAYAHKMFDYLNNNMAVGEYNLPTRSARKSLKTDEVSVPLCVFFTMRETKLSFAVGTSRIYAQCV